MPSALGLVPASGRYLQAKEPAVAPIKEGGEAPAYGSIYFRGPDTDPPTLTVKFRPP
jgi:hypothetical protein